VKHVLDVSATFSNIKQLATALETCVVDDTHLSARWGILLARLTDSFQARLAQQHFSLSEFQRGELGANQQGASVVPEVSEITIQAPNVSDRTQHQSHQDPTFNLHANVNGTNAALQASNFDVYSMWWDITRPVDAMTADQHTQYGPIPTLEIETDMSLHEVPLGSGHDSSFGFPTNLF
jgi:hypothetical protein